MIETNQLKVITEPINFLNTRIRGTYFQNQNEKDISILSDQDLALQNCYCLKNLYGSLLVTDEEYCK